MKTRAGTSRRGAAYLIALLAGSIVTVTGLAALSLTTGRTRTTAMADQATKARSLAGTGLEHALCAVATHIDNGGTRHDIFGSAEPSVSFGGGTFGWSMRNMDGTAVDNSDQPIVIRTKAQHGPARYAMRATLVPSGVPYDVLQTGMYVGGTIDIGLLANIPGNSIIGATGNINIGLTATGTAPLESAGTASGLGELLYSGTRTSGAAERYVPDESLLDYYLALGERINIASLPTISGSYYLHNILLSPASNPFGDTNEHGIYIIDCNGDSTRLVVQNIRVVGTLVLLNTSTSRVIIGGSTLIQPAFEWMPSLMVQGGATFAGTATGPNEAIIGENLNPPATPYNFDYDSDTSDAYPAGIEGVSYIAGNASFSLPRQVIRGTMIITGNARVSNSVVLDVTYDPKVATLPPFGFFEDTGGLAIAPSSVVWSTPD